MRRSLFIVPALAALAGMMPGPSRADPYAWCAQYSEHAGGRPQLRLRLAAAVPGDRERQRRLLRAESPLHRCAPTAAAAPLRPPRLGGDAGLADRNSGLYPGAQPVAGGALSATDLAVAHLLRNLAA